jgi:hypothetical protein
LGEQLDLLLACLIDDPETGQTGGECPFGTRNNAPNYSRDQLRVFLQGTSVVGAGGSGGSY